MPSSSVSLLASSFFLFIFSQRLHLLFSIGSYTLLLIINVSSLSAFTIILPVSTPTKQSSVQQNKLYYRTPHQSTERFVATMDSDIARIRREKWLQHQQEQSNNSSVATTTSSEINNTNIISSPTSRKNKLHKQNSSSYLSANEQKINNHDDSIINIKNKNNKYHHKEIIDITSTSPIKNNDVKVTSMIDNPTKKRQKLSSKASASSAIDLTFSSDEDDEDYNVKQSSSTSSSKRDTFKRPKPKSACTINSQSTTTTSSSLEIKNQFNQIPQFSIVTYNIWFGQAHPTKRMMEISNLICNLHDKKPLFIGLQEVTNDLLNDLFPLLQSLGYTMITQDDCFHSYGVAIAVLTSIYGNDKNEQYIAQTIKSGFHPYQETIMGRGLLWVHARITNEQPTSSSSHFDVLFTTTHLESFIPKNQYSLPDTHNHDGAKARKSQIKEAVSFCFNYRQKQITVSSSGSNGIKALFITGDLNWDDERKGKGSNCTDEPLLPTINTPSLSWIDAWKDCNSNQEGYTYDSKLNPMLKGNLRRRFDRCLCYINGDTGKKQQQGDEEKLFVNNAQLIGTEAIEGIEWKKEVAEYKYGKPTGATTIQTRAVCPSDHFGLYVQFGRSK